MKKFLTILMMVSFLLIGCTTVKTNSTVAEENCFIYNNQTVCNLVMWAIVAGSKVLAAERPDYYILVQKSAQVTASLLKSKPVSLKSLTDDKIINLLSPLLSMIPDDAVLCEWDRNYIADHLLMI